VKINRGREDGSVSELRSATFTGEVWADSVLDNAPEALINDVFFAPRGRTHWHTHERGQILLVLAGRGWVRRRDGEGGEIVAGDVVWISPGEEHWHGAGDDSFLLHRAISLGVTEWLDAVSDDDYAQKG
jgi:quercetin dioxygenase-like cupin family protein